MRKKKSFHPSIDFRPEFQHGDNLKSNNQPAAVDLDPTTNHSLYQDVWDQLMNRIIGEKNVTNTKFPVLPEALWNSGPPCLSNEREFGQSIRRLVKLVCKAVLHPIYIPWDAQQFYDQHVKRGNDKRRVKFPNPHFGAFSEPLTVVDSNNNIVLWFLPGLISVSQQSEIQEATRSIAPLLKSSVKTGVPENINSNWRINEANYVEQDHTRILEPGAATFSAGWFAQGHTSGGYPLMPSYNLRKKHEKRYSRYWIETSNNLERFLNLTLSLVNPDLFYSGLLTLEKLRELETTKDIAQHWQSVYTGISVISNRLTPPHRDSKGRPEWFDTIVNYSNLSSPRLFFEDLGLELEYSGGTVVAFCGSVFKHEVGAWGDGDRVCYAHFMRKSVLEHLKVPVAGWVKHKMYFPTE